MILVDPDGGDFGLAKFQTKLENIPLIVETVAGVFSSLKELKPNDRIFAYCISFNSDYKKLVEALLLDLERRSLPRDISFYETDGRRIFDIRGASGGVTTSTCFYIICK